MKPRSRKPAERRYCVYLLTLLHLLIPTNHSSTSNTRHCTLCGSWTWSFKMFFSNVRPNHEQSPTHTAPKHIMWIPTYSQRPLEVTHVIQEYLPWDSYTRDPRPITFPSWVLNCEKTKSRTTYIVHSFTFLFYKGEKRLLSFMQSCKEAKPLWVFVIYKGHMVWSPPYLSSCIYLG